MERKREAQVQSFVQGPPSKSLTKSINVSSTHPRCHAEKAPLRDMSQIQCTRNHTQRYSKTMLQDKGKAQVTLFPSILILHPSSELQLVSGLHHRMLHLCRCIFPVRYTDDAIFPLLSCQGNGDLCSF